MSKRTLPVALVAVMAAIAADPQLAFSQEKEIRPTIAGDTQTLADKGLLADSDDDFLKHAVRAGAIEIQAARLAMLKASRGDVKAFAEQLVTDHTAQAKELTQWATKKNIVLKDDDPTLKMKMDKHESLQAKTGADFDIEFLEAIISDHRDTAILFVNEKLRSQDALLKAFADQALQTIRQHLQTARDLRAKFVLEDCRSRVRVQMRDPGVN